MELNYTELLNSVKNDPSIVRTNEDMKFFEDFLADKHINMRLKETYDSKDYFDPKDGEYAPKGSLWNNPAINKLKNKMTPEQLEYFESQGRDMYNYDFANADIDAQLKEITEYVIVGLKSGLHPRDLTEDEKDAMCEIYGPTWYLKYEFTEEEVYGDDED